MYIGSSSTASAIGPGGFGVNAGRAVLSSSLGGSSPQNNNIFCQSSFHLFHHDGTTVGQVTRGEPGGFNVYYEGYLKRRPYPIWAWVRLNGRGFKPIQMHLSGSSGVHMADVFQSNSEVSEIFFHGYDNGRLNDWDIEVYFVNENNEYDSNHGANFTGKLLAPLEDVRFY
jgi:hypothetical protein